MSITKIDNPTWNGNIKEILLPHSLSFSLNGIPDNAPLLNQWWEYMNEHGTSLGFGWIDFDLNENGQKEGEISLCVKSGNHGQQIGSKLLAFLEEEVSKTGTCVTSVVVKKCNPEYDAVVNWFQGKNYEIVSNIGTATYMVKC